MKIEHAAMYVNDIEKAKDFFVRYFRAAANGGYHNDSTGFSSYFLSFDGGARLEIMNRPSVQKLDNSQERTGFAHIAFSLGSREKVDELTLRMKNDGYEVRSGPRLTGDGYYESLVIGIEGNLIEITV